MRVAFGFAVVFFAAVEVFLVLGAALVAAPVFFFDVVAMFFHSP
jgi:hypothetical protein